MKLYLDLIFLINIWFDFLLLLAVSMLLKRNTKFKRIIFGSLFGGLTFFILFIELNNIELLIYKFIISIFMIIITFSYKSLKYTLINLGYFYLTSIILGGGMYLLNDSFNYSSRGLILYNNEIEVNYIVLVLFSPLVIIFYLKNSLNLKNNYSNYHKVDILYKDKLYHLNGYLDTGNNLYDSYRGRGVILVKNDIPYNLEDIIYVPYEGLNHNGLVKCLKPDRLYVDKVLFENYLIGISQEDFKIDGIDCILHNKMKGKLK